MSVFPAVNRPSLVPREASPAEAPESEADIAAREWLELMRRRHPIHFVRETGKAR